MESIIELISQIPDVIWGAIFALSGVLLANKNNKNNQVMLLEHEKQKYQSEQNLALKKEVFLDVARSFADVLGIIPNLMNLEFTQKDIETKTADHSGIVAKSYLVAKESSVVEILNYSAETGEVFIKLMKERGVVLGHKEAKESYQSTINSAEKKQDRIILRMQELNHQGNNNQAIFNDLNESYDTQKLIIKKNTESLYEKESIFESSYRLFAEECINDYSKLLSLLSPMAIALREELGNDQDSQVFIDALNNDIQRMRVAFNNLLEE